MMHETEGAGPAAEPVDHTANTTAHNGATTGGAERKVGGIRLFLSTSRVGELTL